MNSGAGVQPGQEDSPLLALVIEQGDDAPAVARTAISAFCETRDIPESISATVTLLVSEVVTNAVTHPDVQRPASVRLFARAEAGIIRVEVIDRGNGFEPTIRPDPSLSGSGYGLFLLDRQALRWGVDDIGGNRVWFEVALEEGIREALS